MFGLLYKNPRPSTFIIVEGKSKEESSLNITMKATRRKDSWDPRKQYLEVCTPLMDDPMRVHDKFVAIYFDPRGSCEIAASVSEKDLARMREHLATAIAGLLGQRQHVPYLARSLVEFLGEAMRFFYLIARNAETTGGRMTTGSNPSRPLGKSKPQGERATSREQLSKGRRWVGGRFSPGPPVPPPK